MHLAKFPDIKIVNPPTPILVQFIRHCLFGETTDM